MSDDIAARRFDWSGSGVAGEMVSIWESGDVADRSLAPVAVDAEGLVDTAKVGEEISSDLFLFGFDAVHRSILREKPRCGFGAEVDRCATGNQVGSMPVETVYDASAFPCELVASVSEQSEHSGVVVG